MARTDYTDLVELIERMVDAKIEKALATEKHQSVTPRVATVSEVDGEGRIWVDVGDQQVPIAYNNADVEPGDLITYSVANGRAYLGGNYSAPATSRQYVDRGITQVNRIVGKVKDDADLAKIAAEEADKVAKATNQHFWHRATDPDQDEAGTGAFVTDEDQTSFLEAIAAGTEPTETRPLHNLLMNAEGILLRAAKRVRAAFLPSGVAFFDGEGNDSANVVANFDKDGAQIGKTSSQHAVLSSGGLSVYNGDGTLAEINSVNLSAVEAAAESAQTSAGLATEAAATAGQQAAVASDQAAAAQSSATQANSYATNALMGLSDVEKVVGTLAWISEHGTYSKTSDTTVQAGRQYYELVDGSYRPVQEATDAGLCTYALTEDQALDQDKTYYERTATYTYALTEDQALDQDKTYYAQDVTYTYSLTQDNEIDQGKTYYTYDSGEDEYVAVAEPDVADIATYYERTESVSYRAVAEPTVEDIKSYYERTEHVAYTPVASPDVSLIETYYERDVLYYELSIDESVQNYIASHLSMTGEGLNLTADNTMYRALLAADGLRIIDPQGNVVGVHGQEIQLGSTSGIYFSASSGMLTFRTADEPIAWFGQNADGIWEMHIQNTYAEDMVRFGDYAFIKRQNGNMSLKWLGDDE